jgi:hypothetical protein
MAREVRMRVRWIASVALAGLALAAPSWAAPEGWHESIDDGLEAAAKSGKPLLVVTAWKSGV